MVSASVSPVDGEMMGASVQGSDDGEIGATAADDPPAVISDKRGSSMMMD